MEAKEFSKKMREAYEEMTPEQKKEIEDGIQKMEKAGLFRLANDTEK